MKNIIKNIKKLFKKNQKKVIILAINLILLTAGFVLDKLIPILLLLFLIDLGLYIYKVIKTPKLSKKKKKKIFFKILIAGLILFIIALIGLIVFIFIIIKNAPDFNPDKLYNKEATVIYDKDGGVIAKIGSQIREVITYDEMPQVLVDAIVATEDSRFFSHNGFDLPRFMKASVGQVMGNSNAGGASTLTMQISKNAFTSTESNGIEGIMRKFTDIYISVFKIEKKYTKFEILEFYANTNYLGSGAWGVEQASQVYFGKSAKDMNLAEAATIAGLFNAPNALDPYINPEGANARKNVVLYLMERHGYISEEEKQLATDINVQDLLVESSKKAGAYQAFINTVTAEIEAKTGNNPYVVPMEIYTTMDRDKQEHIDSIMNGETYVWENDFVNAGIAVVDVETGALVAVGAGRNHTGQKVFNFATMTKRQIGSTAKPLYDYAPGFEFNNWSTAQPFTDEPHAYSSGTSINNWDNKFGGFMTLREALKTSRNVPALKAFQLTSNSKIKDFVLSLGLSPNIEGGSVNEAHSLGGYNGESPLSMAAAYASFASGGYYSEPYSYTKIVYKETGEVIEQKQARTKVMKPETAYLITNVLLDAAKWGLYGNYPVNGVTYAAKTGTTNFSQATIDAWGLSSTAINDLWIASYSSHYAIAQWYGYEEINPDYYTKFGNANFRKLFQTVAKGIYTEQSTFTKPSSIIEVAVEKETSPLKLPSEFTPSSMIIKELFIKGTEPTEVSERYSKLNDASNLKSSVLGSNITLTWDNATTPKYADLEYLTSYYNSIYLDSSFATKYLNTHLTYNKDNIGDFGYQIYLKNGTELQSIGFTKDNTFTYNSTGNANLTFVVKSAYSIFKANASDGIEIVVKKDFSNVNSVLNGSSTVNQSVGSTYTEIAKPVTVTSDSVDVTSSATITKVIEDGFGNVVTKVDTTKPGVFYITYTVTYGSYAKTHTRTVIITA